MNPDVPSWRIEIERYLAGVISPGGGAIPCENLVESLKNLDQIVIHHRAEMPPDLVHYLERRSYEKALAFCRGMGRGHAG